MIKYDSVPTFFWYVVGHHLGSDQVHVPDNGTRDIKIIVQRVV